MAYTYSIKILMAKARAYGVMFRREGDLLQARVKGDVPADLVAELKRRRKQVIKFLDDELKGENRKFLN